MIAIAQPRTAIKSIFFDLSALAFIYFVPALSHLISLPVYLIEPMRLMLILAIAHTSRKNAYLIALTLPLFSFLISAHPFFLKTMLITLELVFNIWLFYFLADRIKNQFTAMLASIFASKLLYYFLKFGLISFALIDSSLISTPIWIQVVTMVIFSGYLFFISGLLKSNSDQEKVSS